MDYLGKTLLGTAPLNPSFFHLSLCHSVCEESVLLFMFQHMCVITFVLASPAYR